MKFRFLLFSFFMYQCSFSHEGITVYSSYLSDNYCLIHPSMVGVANYAKVRLTARKQWFDQSDAPQMQTLSFNGRVGEKSGAGIIVFYDKKRNHSQKGVKFSFAHHIMFSRDEIDLNQLSFGVNAGLIQSQLSQTEFLQSGDYDHFVDGYFVVKDSYFNVDVGALYNFLDFYAHATVKNAIETGSEIYTEYESDNLRKYLLSAGFIFGNKEKIVCESSILFKLVEKTQEKMININLKDYKKLGFGKFWGESSYGRSLDGAEYKNDNSVSVQKSQYFTPIVGVNYNNAIFAFTYSQMIDDVKFDNGGCHQIMHGINLFCKPEKYECNCPAIN